LFSRFFHRPSEAVVPVPKGRSSLYLFISVFIILSLAIIAVPSFLLVSDAPVKADAVVVFIGGENGSREKEAEQLVGEGFAEYFIIPAYGQVRKRGPDGNLEPFNWKRPEGVPHRQTNKLTKQGNRFIENTHLEALMAKRLMENLGLRSALLVSSPYHMRRIKMITGKVFQDQMTASYIPTRFEMFGKGFWLLNNSEREFVLMELAKIAWFLVYSPFH